MTAHAPVRVYAAITRGALGGTLLLQTPWARQAIPEAERQAIADRVPDGMTLTLGARTSRTDWSVRLYHRDRNPAEPTIELLHQRDARRALETALGRLTEYTPFQNDYGDDEP